MKDYILLLPILFIFHDMEEIIGFGHFFKNNILLFERFPKITAAYKDFSTEGFALAVYEEFIPFFDISLLAFFFPCKMLNTLWLVLIPVAIIGMILNLKFAHSLMHKYGKKLSCK